MHSISQDGRSSKKGNLDQLCVHEQLAYTVGSSFQLFPEQVRISFNECSVGVATSPQGCSGERLLHSKTRRFRKPRRPAYRFHDFNIFYRKPSETNSTQGVLWHGMRQAASRSHAGEWERQRGWASFAPWCSDTSWPTRFRPDDKWRNPCKTESSRSLGEPPWNGARGDVQAQSCLQHPLHCSDCTPLISIDYR